MDFDVVRFRIPGIDDLSPLPRVLAVVGLIVIITNHALFPASEGSEGSRTFTEALVLVSSACCATLPWIGSRLKEAAFRQVSASPAGAGLDCMQTLAFDAELPKSSRLDLSWGTASLLRLTNADGLALWLPSEGGAGGKVVCTRGMLRQMSSFSQGSATILQSLSSAWRPGGPVNAYCATSQGLASFPEGSLPKEVLPSKTEAVVLKPLPKTGGIVALWSFKARAFDRATDRAWVEQVALRFDEVLCGDAATALQAPVPSKLPERCVEKGEFGFLTQQSLEAESRDPFLQFAPQIRVAPGLLGFMFLGLIAVNRISFASTATAIEGIDSTQTRADICAGVLSIALLGQSLVWLSETPRKPDIEDPTQWEAVANVIALDERMLPPEAIAELLWVWSALSACTRTCSMTVLWRETCLMQGGYFKKSRRGVVVRPALGRFSRELMARGKGRYMPELRFYPAKAEYLEYLPEETPGVLVTPLSVSKGAPSEGVVVVAADAVRGLGRIDQAWIGALTEKLGVTLASCGA